MLIIRFENGQGLGNQLWCFAVAKSLSEKLNTELYIQDLHKFKGKDFLKLNYQIIKDINLENKLINKSIKTFNERTFYDSKIKYLLTGFDERVLKIKEDTLLKGNFQSEKYFFNDFEKLNNYISIKQNIKEDIYIDSDTCILNIRGGEYKRHKNFLLPISYWKNAMDNFRDRFNIHKFKIVTDDYKYAKSIFPNLEVIHGDIKECYLSIYKCSNIIVSNSSFSYFPCKTGNIKNVIAPMYWARHKNNFGRWISPCNIYKDWLWQDHKNKIWKYDECIKIANATEEYYKERFTILISRKDIPKTGIFYFIPKRIKQLLKKLLSYVLPRHFG